MTNKHTKKRRYVLSKERAVKVILILAVLWFAISFSVTSIIGLLIKTEIVGAKIAESVSSAYGLVSYQSYLVESPLNGQGTPITSEGTRVRKNEAVYRITAPDGSAMQQEQEKIMYAPLAGIVSYHVDGYEAIKTMDDVMALDLVQIKKAEADKKWDSQLTAGMPYAKIINNLDEMYIYMDCVQDPYTETFEEGSKIRIRFSENNYSTICRIVEIVPWLKGDQSRFWIKADLGTVEQSVLMKRVWQVELPYDVSVILEIDKNAVIYREGQPGVYILDKGFASWKKITLVQEREDTFVIEGLTEGTEIVTTPNLVGEGEQVKVKG